MRRKIASRTIGSLAILLFFAFSVLPVPAQEGNSEKHDEKPAQQHEAVEAAQVSAAPIADRSSVSCLADPTVLDDLRRNREILDQREKEAAAREADLKSREQALNEELKKLEEVRNEIATIDSSRKKENEERVNKLVETLETMNPKAASQLLGSLEDALAVASMSKMSTPKLAKMMNIMEPKRSSRLTELMAGVVRAKASNASNGASATTTDRSNERSDETKGGEKKNEHGKQSEQTNSS